MGDEVAGTKSNGAQLGRAVAAGFAEGAALAFPIGGLSSKLLGNVLRKLLPAPPKDSAEQRAEVVTAALTLASELLDDLQAEVRAKLAVVDALETRVQSAESRASYAEIRASLSEEQAQAVDDFLDRSGKEREQSSKRREWVLATGVALAVGVASTLVSHFLFGF